MPHKINIPFFIISCEHGGNKIPKAYRPFFNGRKPLLQSHEGFDSGALSLARVLAKYLNAPLLWSTISRLLVDLNRSQGHPHFYSAITRQFPQSLREEIVTRYYLPYREAVKNAIRLAIKQHRSAIHISCHSFTPKLHGQMRNADIGLLYDPARMREREFCLTWQRALKRLNPGLNVRRNYPYQGVSDGLTSFLRTQFSEARYLGIELEINQARIRHASWPRVRQQVVNALRIAAHNVS